MIEQHRGRVSKLNLARRCLATVLLLAATSCDLFTSPYEFPKWTAMAVDRFQSCGISEGAVFCWGEIPGYPDNVTVLHSDSLFPNTTTPIRVPSKDTYTQVSMRQGTLCALGTLDRGYCAGLNATGAAGDGTLYARRGLSEIIDGHQWKMVRGNAYHSCGLLITGEAYCWGEQYRGKLGNGVDNLVMVLNPVAVSGGHIFESIDVSVGFACGLTAAGQAWCWGAHDGVYLGVGSEVTTASHAVPIAVHGAHTFRQLSLGDHHACGVTVESEAYCWGQSFWGQLGDGTEAQRGEPTLVKGGHKWARIHAGRVFTCGVTSTGAVYCWGENEYGQFGPGAPAKSLVPYLVAYAGKYRDIAVGGEHMCGIRFDRTAECWGRGDYGQLGNGERSNSSYPVRVIR